MADTGIKILQWNICSFKVRNLELLSHINDCNYDVILLQETNITARDRAGIEIQGYSLYFQYPDIYITDASVFMLSIQLLVNSYDPGMEIPTSELPSLGRHIYNTDASVSMLSIKLLEYTYVPGMEIPIPKLPSLGRYIYITDAWVSTLSIQLLEYTYVPGMKIPLPQLPPLGRYIYHKCVSLYAEHTIIGTHLCPRHGDSCTRINRPWVDLYITDASVSMLSKQLLKNTYAPGMEIPIPELPLLGRHIDITDASVSILSMQLLEHT